MKVAVYEGIKQITIKNWEIPKLKENEILIKIKASGVCATDVKTYLRGHPAFTPPTVLGHEYAGVIEAIGKNVTICKVGERVTAAPYIECGHCIYCENGDEELCQNKLFASNGAFAEYIILEEEFAKRSMVKLPEYIDFDVASLTEPLACCINAINQCQIKTGDNVLIIGAGTMGIINGLVCKSRDAKNVIISDFNEERLKIAEKLGLIPVNVNKEDLAVVVDSLTNKLKCDAVIVAVGNAKVVEDGFKYVRKGGKLHIFGGTPKDSTIQIEAYLIHYSKIMLLGSSGFTEANFKEAIDIINESGDLLKEVITHRYNIDEIETAINNVAQGQGLKSTIIFE